MRPLWTITHQQIKQPRSTSIKKKTNRLKKQNPESRNKSKHIKSTNIWQGSQKHSMGKKQCL